MGSLYRIAAQRAQSYLELPEELPTRPAGYSGTSIVGGRLGTEYEHNVEWATPRARAKVVSKMLRTSSILALAEEYLSGRVTACKLHVPRQEGKSAEAAEAIERWLGIGEFEDAGGRLGSNMAIDDLLRHMLSARLYGNAALSEAWEFDETSGLYWCSLHRRRQESYDAYITDDSERLLGIVQRVGYTGGTVDRRVLPLGETLFIAHRPDLGWFDGRSVLRPCYPHWRSEQLRYRLEDLAANKYADPPQRCVLDVDRFARFANGGDGAPVSRDDYTTEIAGMKNKLEGLHSEESGHILMADWWKLEEASSRAGAYNPEPLLRSAEHHQRVMAERLYVAWQLQGRRGDGGSRSMVETQSEVVQDATVDCLQWILNALNRQTVRRFLKVNFSSLDPSEWPFVTFERGSITTPWWQKNAQAFASFVSQNILTMSEEDERAIRAASDLPPPPDNSPDAVDRQALNAGGRMKTPAGQREARSPGRSRPTPNRFVERLVEREDDA